MKALVFALVILLAACSTGPHYSEVQKPGDQEALVYLFRIQGNSFLNTTFAVEGTRVVSMGNNEYSWLNLPPGRYHIRAYDPNAGTVSLILNAKAGETYYVGYNLERGRYRSRMTLRGYDEEDADDLLDRAKYKEVVRLPEAAQRP